MQVFDHCGHDETKLTQTLPTVSFVIPCLDFCPSSLHCFRKPGAKNIFPQRQYNTLIMQLHCFVAEWGGQRHMKEGLEARRGARAMDYERT